MRPRYPTPSEIRGQVRRATHPELSDRLARRTYEADPANGGGGQRCASAGHRKLTVAVFGSDAAVRIFVMFSRPGDPHCGRGLAIGARVAVRR